MAFGWEGAHVRLVPLEREKHFENCVRWLNDPEVTAWTLMGDFPLTRLAEQEFFERAAKESDTMVVFAIETREEEHIGVTGLHDISFRHGSATSGTIIGRRSLWGRGLGTETVAVRSRYAFEVLGLRMVLSHAFADNVASLRMLARNGYCEVGRLPQRFWKRGAYRDLVLLLLTQEAWRRAVPAPTKH